MFEKFGALKIPLIVSLAAILVILLGRWDIAGPLTNTATIEVETKEAFIEMLMGLFAVALLMERVQEVFVIATRQAGRKEVDTLLTNAKLAAADSGASIDAQNLAVVKEESDLVVYKTETQQAALNFGLFFGFVAAIAGVRSISLLIVSENLVGLQADIFMVLDIVITTGVIAGGSEAIHQLVSIFTDFYDDARKKIKA